MTNKRYRIAELWVPLEKGYRLGTGFMIRSKLIVTAEHLFENSKKDYNNSVIAFIRFLEGDDNLFTVKPIWSDKFLDIIILEVIDANNYVLQVKPFEIGIFARESFTQCEACGFPISLIEKHPDSSLFRESVGLYGVLDPHGGIRGKYLPFDVSNPFQSTQEYKGLSGAPVFAENCLMGIILSSIEPFSGRRLKVFPIAELIYNDQSNSLLKYSFQEVRSIGGEIKLNINDEIILEPDRYSKEIDLRIPNWPARDQGDRGTTVSFAIIACREYIELKAKTVSNDFRLSEGFHAWVTKTQTNDAVSNIDGTYLQNGIEAMKLYGTCLSESWPYNPKFIPNYKEYAKDLILKENILYEAAKYRKSARFHRKINKKDNAGSILLTLLDRYELPVIVVIPVYRSWFECGWTEATGELNNPLPSDLNNISNYMGNICICVTGFIPDPEHGGSFSFRNSWGTFWGRDSTIEAGYGIIHSRYINSYAIEICVL